MKKGDQVWTYQSNKKGVIPVVLERDVPPGFPSWVIARRLDGKGNIAESCTVFSGHLFTHPEVARDNLLTHHEETLANHEDNARKSRHNIEKVRAQKIPAGMPA